MTKRKNHSPEFKAKVALDAIREEMTLAELSTKYGVHTTQISTWKRAAIQNMASAFSRRGHDPAAPSTADIENCIPRSGSWWWSGIFLADASVQLLGARGKNGEQGS